MNKKIVFIIVSLMSVSALVACNKNKENNSSDSGPKPYETGEKKNLKGTGTIFNEVIGYNTKDASIFEDGDARYVVYASNETEKGAQVFAARKATKVDGKWVYGDKSIILKGEENSWDQRIYNPSILKGQYSYQGTTYQYLMAYNGNNNSNGTDNHIGLAVSNDVLSGWKRVGSQPIMRNPEVFEASYGFGSPSLVSYDQQGKGYLFYAVGEREVSFTAMKSFDFSNLDQMVLEGGYTSLPITGLTDKVEGAAIIMNAGFALSNDGASLMMVRDRLPQSANKPNQTSEVEIDKASLAILSDVSQSWTVVDNITGMKTMDVDDEESLGWDQIYSGEFITDPYGKLLSFTNAEVLYSTYDEEASEPSYSSTLAVYGVTL